jgi:hypothetical protein
MTDKCERVHFLFWLEVQTCIFEIFEHSGLSAKAFEAFVIYILTASIVMIIFRAKNIVLSLLTLKKIFEAFSFVFSFF